MGFGEFGQKKKANLFDAHLELAIRLGLWTRLVQRPDTSRFANACEPACARLHDDVYELCVDCALPQFESFYSPIMDGQKFESNHERLSSRFLHQSEVNRYSPDSECLLTTPSVGERTLIGLSPIKSLYCVSTMIEAWFPVVTEQWRELGSKYIR